jgi:hypothetical protein
MRDRSGLCDWLGPRSIAKCSSGATEPLVEFVERLIEALRVGIQWLRVV